MTLTAYEWNSPGHTNAIFPAARDLVQARNDAPGAGVDYQAFFTINITPTVPVQGGATPEPGTLSLMGTGILGLVAWRRRKGQ